jgi:hypothetical protein
MEEPTSVLLQKGLSENVFHIIQGQKGIILYFSIKRKTRNPLDTLSSREKNNE